MYVNDPIGDMLTRVRNGIMARKEEVSIPYSTVKEEIARILMEEGYVVAYSVEEGQPYNWLKVQLKYVGVRRLRRSVITGLERVSKPGRRIYAGFKEIPWVRSGMGICILTTPKGLMTGQTARRKHLGGEVLCKIW